MTSHEKNGPYKIAIMFLLGAVTMWLLVSVFSTEAASNENPHTRMSQQRCTDHDRFVAHLKERYGETRRGMGLVSEQAVMQVYVSEEKRSWTILLTYPSGQACLIAAGRGWEDLEARPPEIKS